MLPLGHVGIALLISTLLYLPALFVLLGILLPDVVDKLLFFSSSAFCGRFFGHTIFFGPIVSLLTYIITKRKDFALAVLFGSYIHLLQDSGNFIPWFYPIVNYQLECVPRIYIGIFEIITEALGASLIVVKIFFNSKLLYYRDKLRRKIKKMLS